MNPSSQASVNAALARGDIISWGQQSHAFDVLGYNSAANTYTVDNPYSAGVSGGELQYNWGQMEHALTTQMGFSASTPLPGDVLGPKPPLATVWPTVAPNKAHTGATLSVAVPAGTADAAKLTFTWSYLAGPARTPTTSGRTPMAT